ncbi:MAG: apolipoprotein N-acyltransferase [Myxococcales bacterium]|nr:apolipoprotein N-acyltransferase [Myxococcales bacterium]
MANRRKTGNARSEQPEKAHPSRIARVGGDLGAVASGVLIFMSYPNFSGIELFPLQWFSLVPLLWSIQSQSTRRAVFLGFLTGLVTNLGGFYWLTNLLQEFGHLPYWVAVVLWSLISAYQGLVFVLFVLFGKLATERYRVPMIVSVPVAMVVSEMLVPFIFPWYFANGQYRFTAISQIVDITGVSGLTYLISAVNTALFVVLWSFKTKSRFPVGSVVVAVVLFLCTLGYGAIRLPEIDGAANAAPKLRVGMVEANIGIWEKEAKSLPPEVRTPTLLFNLVKHQRLSQLAVEQGAELLVWPESSYIPISEVSVKTTDLFGIAVGVGGVAAECRENKWMPLEVRPSLQTPTTTWLSAWAGREDAIYIAGENGLLARYDQRNWTNLDTGTTKTLRAVVGNVEPTGQISSIWVGGDGGVLLRCTGDQCTPQPFVDGVSVAGLALERRSLRLWAAGENGAVYARSVGSPSGIWERIVGDDSKPLSAIWIGENWGAAVGAAGTLWFRKDGTWNRIALGTTENLHAVWGSSGHQVFVVGDAGTVFRFDGSRWAAESLPVGTSFRAVMGTDLGDIFAAGESGMMAFRRDDGTWETFTLPGRPELFGLAAVGYHPDFPIPGDVRYLAPSSHKLPSADNPVDMFEEERRVPLRDRVSLLRGFQKPILFGALLYEIDGLTGRRLLFNSALLVDAHGKLLGRYDKNYLLMFGEYIPLGEMFPFLYDWIPEAGRFEAGTTVETFDFFGTQIGVMICYEDILPRFTRRLASKKTHLLVNVTNDAWFGKTSEPYHHLALATMRSIETRRSMVRSTNTGVSAFIDPAGRIRKQTDIHNAEVLVDDVPLMDLDPIYIRIGDVFLAANFVALTLIFVGGHLTERSQRVRKGKRKS